MDKGIWDYSGISGRLDINELKRSGYSKLIVSNLPNVEIKNWDFILDLLKSVSLNNEQLIDIIDCSLYDIAEVDNGIYCFLVTTKCPIYKPIMSDKLLSYKKIEYVDNNLNTINYNNFKEIKINNLPKLLNIINLQIELEKESRSSSVIEYIRESIRNNKYVDDIFIKTDLEILINNLFIKNTLGNYILEKREFEKPCNSYI